MRDYGEKSGKQDISDSMRSRKEKLWRIEEYVQEAELIEL